jgi:hypothetical protein
MRQLRRSSSRIPLFDILPKPFGGAPNSSDRAPEKPVLVPMTRATRVSALQNEQPFEADPQCVTKFVASPSHQIKGFTQFVRL